MPEGNVLETDHPYLREPIPQPAARDPEVGPMKLDRRLLHIFKHGWKAQESEWQFRMLCVSQYCPAHPPHLTDRDAVDS